MVPQVGQRIGPYEILGRLGSGGMGLVFSAWDSRLQRDVAVKMLREEFATPGMRSRFLLEARAASRLNHPNICTIFDIGETQGEPYLVMELLKGETVRSRITRGPINPEDILRVAMEIADGLSVAHARGIIHRDIKPANIVMVERPGGGFQTKVLDFGLAKIDLEDDLETRFALTGKGTTVGTVAYMSPEQARGEVLDARSDLFSLGVVLYEMATGELPFQGATSALVFVQLLSHPPRGVRELNPGVPKSLEKVILTLLEKERAARIQTATDLVEELQRVVVKGSGSRSSWGGSAPRSERPSRPEGPPPLPSDRSRLTEAEAARAASSSESVLRPVKRVVTGEFARPSFGTDSGPGSASAGAGPGAAAPAVPAPTSSGSMAPASSGAVSAASGSGQEAVAPGGTGSGAPPPTNAGDRRPSGSESSVAGAGARGASGQRSASDPLKIAAFDAMMESRKAPALRPSPRFQSPEAIDLKTLDVKAEGDEDELPPVDDEPEAGSSRRRLWIAIVSLLPLVVGGLIAWHLMSRRATPTPSAPVSLVLAPLTNRTGDSALAAELVSGLQFAMAESPLLSVHDSGDFSAGLKVVLGHDTAEPSLEQAREAARMIGCDHVVYGDMNRDGGIYFLSLRVYDTTTGARTAEVSESANNRGELADAIDRLAADLRSGLGESGESIARTSIPLSREATSNLEALQAYTAGASQLSAGHLADAIAAFQHAVALEPHFTQAYLRLADLYRRQHAEVAAADVASRAEENSGDASSRTQLLAKAANVMDGKGDYPQAITLLQRVVHDHPGDVEALDQIALAQRLSGRYTEALATAQQVLASSPYDLDATGSAELCLLATDRFDGAAQLETRSLRAGRTHPGLGFLIALLSADPNAPPGVSAAMAPDRLSPQVWAASALDAEGLMKDGLTKWKEITARALSNPQLESAASYTLAQAALNRALVSDCSVALELVQQSGTLRQGPTAAYYGGMADAFCGDLDGARRTQERLKADYPQSFAVQNFYLADLAGMVAWKSGDLAGALATLQGAKQFDQVSLTPYLRGMIQISARQPASAVADFQSLLQHRGSTTLISAVAYPMAQLGVSHAYEAAGDTINSREAYGKFLALWRNADRESRLLPVVRASAK